MNPETENFEQLRRLLALKRHEQPPPGYFNDFSSRVIARIKAGEQAEDSFGIGQWFWGGAWLQRLWSAAESKPALAGAFGVLVCALLISGVVYSDSPTRNIVTGTMPAPSLNEMQVADTSTGFAPVVPTTLAMESPSSRGILVTIKSGGGSLLDEIRLPQAQNVNWR